MAAISAAFVESAPVTGGFERHDVGLEIHSDDAQGVVARRGDGPGDVGAVIAGIGHGAGAVHKVVAVHVVHIAVAVVVYAVAGYLAGISPQVADYVRVGEVQAGVNDGYDDLVGGGPGKAPGGQKANVSLGCAAETVYGLAGVLQAPQLAEQGVVWRPHAGDPAQVVRLDHRHRGILA